MMKIGLKAQWFSPTLFAYIKFPYNFVSENSVKTNFITPPELPHEQWCGWVEGRDFIYVYTCLKRERFKLESDIPHVPFNNVELNQNRC